MAARMGFMVAAILCLTTGMNAYAQPTGPISSVYPAVSVAQAPEAIVLRLGDAARLEGMRLAVALTKALCSEEIQ